MHKTFQCHIFHLSVWNVETLSITMSLSQVIIPLSNLPVIPDSMLIFLLKINSQFLLPLIIYYFLLISLYSTWERSLCVLSLLNNFTRPNILQTHLSSKEVHHFIFSHSPLMFHCVCETQICYIVIRFWHLGNFQILDTWIMLK